MRPKYSIGDANVYGVTLVSREGLLPNDTCVFRCPCGKEYASPILAFKRSRGCPACRVASRKREAERVQRLSTQIRLRTPRGQKPPKQLTALGTTSDHLRRMVAQRSLLLGIIPPVVDRAFVDAIVERIGRKPTGGMFKCTLEIVKGAPPVPENFIFARQLTREQLNDLRASTPNLSDACMRKRASKKADGQIERALTSGIQRKRARNREYHKDIGRVFGDFVVVSVALKERAAGVVYSIFNLKCKRCGALKTAYAATIYHGDSLNCKKCGLQDKGNMHRNSAWCLSNKYGRFRSKFRDILDPGLPARLLMVNYTGEFSVFHGTPEYMEARIDADLLGISIGD